jgi:hypothetical protein
LADQYSADNGNKNINILKLLGLENVSRLVGRVFATKEGGKGNAWAPYGEEQVMSDVRPDNKIPMHITTCKATGTVSDGGVINILNLFEGETHLSVVEGVYGPQSAPLFQQW